MITHPYDPVLDSMAYLRAVAVRDTEAADCILTHGDILAILEFVGAVLVERLPDPAVEFVDRWRTEWLAPVEDTK